MAKPPNALVRALIRMFMRFEVRRFRRSRGTRLGFGKHPQLLLTTVGRTTGKERTVPLFFTRDSGRLVVIASYGGSDKHPGWWLNLRAAGKGRVEIGEEAYDVVPTALEGQERQRCWDAMTEFWPAYNDYARKTDRQIPVVALTRSDGNGGEADVP